MRKNKKADLSINVIIVAIIALVVLVVLLFIFNKQIGKSGSAVSDIQDNVEKEKAGALDTLKGILGSDEKDKDAKKTSGQDAESASAGK